MKKISCLLLLYLIAMNHWCFIFAQVNISSEYFGTYIPVEFGNLLNETNSYSKSLENSSKTYHDILFVGNNGIFSDLKFHDGYKVSNGNKYEFYDKDSCKYVIDDKKNIYKAIYIGNTEKNYQVFYEYVINTMFKNLNELKNVTIEGNAIKVDGLNLIFIPDLMFFDNENCDAWFYALEEKGKKRNYYALIKDGITAKFVEGIKDEEDFGWIPGTKVFFEFPIFYYGGDDYLSYEVEKLSKPEIRLLRNLIYAKHGYQFKDKNLLKIFNNFSWYKINPSFTENELSRQEREFIQRCKLLEEK